MADHCLCGHSPQLHASGRYACKIRYRYGCWPDRKMWAPPIRNCECNRYREAPRWREHNWLRHVAVRLWWRTPKRLAWWLIDHWPVPDRCWCDLWSSFEPIEYPERQRDYDGRWQCLCDAPLPTDAGVPDGHCYCPFPRGEAS